MTVGELVKYLKNLDQNMKVMIREHDQVLDGNEFKYRARFPFPVIQRIKDGKVAQRACKDTEGSEKCFTL